MTHARYQLILDRNARHDGRFLIGVLTTGIYCLPFCSARKPKFENVRFFDKEADAQAAGLRPCKRCRPDLFYRGVDIDAACYEDMRAKLEAQHADYADVDALAAQVGVSRSKLTDLCREHGHSTPARLLN
jgi:AraC family transcriptional regulator of adaptative response / DNA-3-methyladenine glycosylase II